MLSATSGGCRLVPTGVGCRGLDGPASPQPAAPRGHPDPSAAGRSGRVRRQQRGAQRAQLLPYGEHAAASLCSHAHKRHVCHCDFRNTALRLTAFNTFVCFWGRLPSADCCWRGDDDHQTHQLWFQWTDTLALMDIHSQAHLNCGSFYVPRKIISLKKQKNKKLGKIHPIIHKKQNRSSWMPVLEAEWIWIVLRLCVFHWHQQRLRGAT